MSTSYTVMGRLGSGAEIMIADRLTEDGANALLRRDESAWPNGIWAIRETHQASDGSCFAYDFEEADPSTGV